MDRAQQPKLHLTIQKGLSIPPLKPCNTCCSPSKFHCPFCAPAIFKPTKLSRVRNHLDHHLRRALCVGEYTIHRCRLECRRQPHLHCLYCPATLIRRSDFINHTSLCHQTQQHRAQNPSQQAAVTHAVQTEGPGAPSLTPAEAERDSDSPSCEMQVSGDDCGGVIIIPESDDHSSQTVHYRIIPNKCDTVGKRKRSTQPGSSRCHQMVQTDIEKPQDCDEFYFMNLVKMFKKLSPQKKAETRMKIERVLFEAEFE